MKKIAPILFIVFWLIPTAAIAQVPEPAMQWLKVIGGNGTDAVLSTVAKTLDGGFVFSYESSSTSGPIDTLCTATYVRSIFEKYNSDASVIEWNKCYLNNIDDSAFLYMFQTMDDGYIMGGISFTNTHKFLIHKDDASGNRSWSKAYGDSAEAIIRSMTATNDGGYIMLGEVSYTNMDFPVHYGGFMNADIGIIKVDSNGNKVWSKVLGGSGDERAWCVVAAADNGCYAIGTTPSDDYDCSGNHGGTSGSTDAYLARLDGNGNLMWHKDLGGTGYDQGNFGWPDGKGGVIVGATSGSNDGDVTHQLTVGGFNMWVINVDSNGTTVWDNCYGGSYEFTNTICKASDGSIWIAGVCKGKGTEVDTAYGNWDAYFVHADSAGNFLSAKVLGSSRQDEGYMIYPLSNGNVIAGGYYEVAGGAFPSINWGGGSDAFLTVFAPWTTSVSDIRDLQNEIKIYPNPASDLLTIEAGNNGTLVITDVIGRCMYRATITDKLQIPIKGWPGGIYYVQAINYNGLRTIKKLLVE